jgi:nifR3 family TIM-barrel protein
MAGITDLSFRRVARNFGVDLVTSEMVSGEGLVRGNPGTRYLLRSHPEEKPLAVQLFGANAQVMAEAARMVADGGADIIDLNMGCPVAKVIRQGAGAALLTDTDKVKRVVDGVRRAVDIPVTVKTRSGWDRSRINVVEVACAAEAAGADAITIHPRTAKQGFSGTADWLVIGEVKQAVRIPVIGNGDVTRPEHVEKIRQVSGCDGVMIGRAAMGNPWIFQQALELAGGRSPLPVPGHERVEIMRRHLSLYQELHPDRPSLAGLRSRLMWYTKGQRGAARLRASLSKCCDSKAMLKTCEDFFASLEEVI